MKYYSETQFIPTLKPCTKLYWYEKPLPSNGLLGKLDMTYNEILPNQSDNLGNLPFDTTRLRWVEPENTPSLSKILFEEFMKDTVYIIYTMSKRFDVTKYATYCYKYGNLFVNSNISIAELYLAFNNLCVMIDLLKDPDTDIDKFCRKLADAFDSECKPTNKKTITFHLLERSKQHVDIPNSGYYHYESIGIIAQRKSFNTSPRLFKLKLQVSIKDLILFREGTSLQKISWLKQQILNNLTSTINKTELSLSTHMENNIPITTITIKDRLMCFLFEMIIGDNIFNICPYCKNLVIGKKKYCDNKHKDLYRKSTDEGKLRDLMGKWLNRDKKINHHQRHKLMERGKELLTQHPYKTVINLLNEELEKDGE